MVAGVLIPRKVTKFSPRHVRDVSILCLIDRGMNSPATIGTPLTGLIDLYGNLLQDTLIKRQSFS
jgi:hypothetical protein